MKPGWEESEYVFCDLQDVARYLAAFRARLRRMNLLEVQNLKVHFLVKHGVFSRVPHLWRLTFASACA